MKNKILKIFFLIISINFVKASPGDASAVFLLIAPGASAVATGEAQVAKSEDVYATYYNPAGLAFQVGREYGGMHVNWLPGLADDIYYEFVGYKEHIPWLGTVGGHIIFLNLGEQIQTNSSQDVLGRFRSFMYAITASYGSKITENSAWGFNVKIIHQKLADNPVEGESGKPNSTDFAFDIGYLKKFERFNVGLAISNIGPEVYFVDNQQADPLPTTMKMGIFANIYEDDSKRLNLLFDANKMLVARYESMDWNENGIIDTADEEGFFDPWYKAIFTSWLDDWYLGGDRDIPVSANNLNGEDQVWIDNNENGCRFLDCNDSNSPIDESEHYNIIGGYSHLEGDGIPGITSGDDFLPTLDDGNGDLKLVEANYQFDIETDQFLPFNHPQYGLYNNEGVKEKGTGDERSFSKELEEMVYSLGLEFWYTENFALRMGYLHDEEGSLKHPTLGAGIRFGQYGFDLGYILGDKGEPRSNTMLFSLNMNID